MHQRITSARMKFMGLWLVRYGNAVVVVGLAFLLRHGFSGLFGTGLTYITFSPAVMLAAILGGIGPGLLATGLAVLAAIWILPPAGLFGPMSTPDAVGLALFSAMGVFMSGVAEMYHRARRRVETYERELARCEVESHKRDFYRRTILGATGGKLLITERQDIDGIAGALLGSWHVGSLDDVSKVRDEITSIARRADMDESRTNELKGCVVEAAGNALKHAGGGDAALYAMDDGLLFVVSDSGPGIGTMELPDVALTKGYSTAGTLGMGYKLMIEFADKVHLFTGTEGTTVAVEVAKHKKPTWPDDVVLRQVTDWKD